MIYLLKNKTNGFISIFLVEVFEMENEHVLINVLVLFWHREFDRVETFVEDEIVSYHNQHEFHVAKQKKDFQ